MKVGDWILINDGQEFDLCWCQITSRDIDIYDNQTDVWVMDPAYPGDVQGYPVHEGEVAEWCEIS